MLDKFNFKKGGVNINDENIEISVEDYKEFLILVKGGLLFTNFINLEILDEKIQKIAEKNNLTFKLLIYKNSKVINLLGNTVEKIDSYFLVSSTNEGIHIHLRKIGDNYLKVIGNEASEIQNLFKDTILDIEEDEFDKIIEKANNFLEENINL